MPLGAAGRAQAAALAERLRPAKLDAIYTSDLARALATAEVVAEVTGAPLTADARLREIDTGLWEGLTPEEACRAYPAEFAERENDVTAYPFPGGESFSGLRDRVLPALDDIVATGHANLLVVAHLGVNRVLLAALRELPLAGIFSIWQGYCEVAAVDVPDSRPGVWRLTVGI